jgi:hypothetical protein
LPNDNPFFAIWQLPSFAFLLPLHVKHLMQTIMQTGTLFFAISILMSFAVWNRINKVYLWPQIKGQEPQKGIQYILFLHCFRFGGLAFLVPGVAGAGLNHAWAAPAAYGDLLAAVLALVTLLLTGNKMFRAFLWIFNIVGFADLLLAFVQGPIYNIVPSLGATYFIIVIYVPLLLLTHLTVFKLLLKSKSLTVSS